VAEGQDRAHIDRVLRTLATASRSLRLYPAASPIPRQSVGAVESALREVFAEGAETLTLVVARDGFECAGLPVAVNVPGGDELAAEFRVRGVSELHFENGAQSDDILKMILLLAKPAEEVRTGGGFAAGLAAEGVQHIGVSEIVLTVIDAASESDILGEGTGGSGGFGGDENELVDDPAKLSTWLSQAAGGDRSDLQAGLVSLVQTVGPEGTGSLASAFAKAFAAQTTDTRDTLLGLAMEPGPFRNLMGEMFRHQSAGEIASSMLAGSFGRNMLSLSAALASLPLDRIDEAVRAQIQAMLPDSGHTGAEARFLDHMIEVRKRTEPEPSLAASDQTYLAVAEAAAIREADLAKARHAVEASGDALDAAGVRTMLALLDQQTEPAQLQESAAGLANLAAHLVASQQVLLADYVIAELVARADRFSLGGLLSALHAPEALGSLLDAAIANPALIEPVGRILRSLDEGIEVPLVSQAIVRKAEGLALAEKLLGKRMIDPLNNAALHAEWYQLRPIVSRLAVEGDSRSMATAEALMRRPDAQSRQEIVAGLAETGGPLAHKLLAELVRDSSNEVAVAAARALAKSRQPGSGDAIAARISQLDLDNADFELGRELIVALSRTPDRSADELLGKLAARRLLIKRGHFNDVQQIVAAALKARSQGAVGQ
jgi:hypothetical protein